MQVTWLDGKDSEGKFVLKIYYKDGSVAFIKNPSLDRLMQWSEFCYRRIPEVEGTTIFDPMWREVA